MEIQGNQTFLFGYISFSTYNRQYSYKDSVFPGVKMDSFSSSVERGLVVVHTLLLLLHCTVVPRETHRTAVAIVSSSMMSSLHPERKARADGGCWMSHTPLMFVWHTDNWSLYGEDNIGGDSINRDKYTDAFSPKMVRSIAARFSKGVKLETTPILLCPASRETGNPRSWIEAYRGALKLLTGEKEVSAETTPLSFDATTTTVVVDDVSHSYLFYVVTFSALRVSIYSRTTTCFLLVSPCISRACVRGSATHTNDTLLLLTDCCGPTVGVDVVPFIMVFVSLLLLS